jgi:hypothetical protein
LRWTARKLPFPKALRVGNGRADQIQTRTSVSGVAPVSLDFCKNMLSQGLCALLAGGLNEPEGWHCVSVVSDEELKVAHPEGSPMTALLPLRLES